MKEIVCCLDLSINTGNEIMSFIRENKIKNIPSSVLDRFKKNLIVTIFYKKESKNFYGWSESSYNNVIKDYTGTTQFELIKIPKNTEIWND